MTELLQERSLIETLQTMDKNPDGVEVRIRQRIEELGYDIIEQDNNRPWGGFIKLSSDQADRFVEDAFPGLSPEETRLGVKDAELSPKIIWVKEEQRLSLQTHERRAERWRFVTSGYYVTGVSDNELSTLHAEAGEVVQFAAGAIHRLCGNPQGEGLVVVAEIWQHTVAQHPSDEADIHRLQDDYNR